jgi:hypothetical protein
MNLPLPLQKWYLAETLLLSKDRSTQNRAYAALQYVLCIQHHQWYVIHPRGAVEDEANGERVPVLPKYNKQRLQNEHPQELSDNQRDDDYGGGDYGDYGDDDCF